MIGLGPDFIDIAVFGLVEVDFPQQIKAEPPNRTCLVVQEGRPVGRTYKTADAMQGRVFPIVGQALIDPGLGEIGLEGIYFFFCQDRQFIKVDKEIPCQLNACILIIGHIFRKVIGECRRAQKTAPGGFS